MTNALLTDSFTIHWHGVVVEKTPWMDGVGPHGQCPIQPLTTFEYRFKATPVGTHFYHDHYENMRRDGLFGFLIIHEASPAPSKKYEHNVALNDWYRDESEDTNMRSPSRLGIPGTGEDSTHNSMRDYAVDGSEITAVTYVSSLINGRGRIGCAATKLTVFEMKKRRKIYKFRVVNAASERAFVVSIDKHQMYIVALDGSPIRQEAMDFVIVQPGERVDIVVRSRNIGRGKYWFRSRTLRAGRGPTVIDDRVIQEVKAIVSYDDDDEQTEPTTEMRKCTSAKRCRVFNCPFPAYPNNQYRDCIDVASVETKYSSSYMNSHYGLDDSNVDETFFNWANLGPGTSVNGRKTIGARGVPLYQDGMGARITPCNATLCDSEGCICTYFVAKDYDKTIQMVFTNLNPQSTELEHHPIHMHGHHFAVLKIGNPNYDPVTGRYLSPNPDVECNNDICAVARWANGPPALNLDNPPLKDTINVPAGGYVVIRFRTMNPGLWFVHCHLASHAIEGMGFYFFEATDRIPPVPDQFPKCGDFDFSDEYYNYYQNL